jgi:GT2 family glycosyltransferase
MDKGAVGGGGPTLFDGIVPLYIRLIAFLAVIGAKLISFTGGAFMFCTREAFHATGGFDERFYWAEEARSPCD